MSVLIGRTLISGNTVTLFTSWSKYRTNSSSGKKKLRIENKQSHILFIWYPLAVIEWLKLIVNIKIRYTVNNLVCSRKSPNEFSTLIVNKWGNLTWVSSWNYWVLTYILIFRKEAKRLNADESDGISATFFAWIWKLYIYMTDHRHTETDHDPSHRCTCINKQISFDSLSQILIIFCDKLQIANINNFVV